MAPNTTPRTPAGIAGRLSRVARTRRVTLIVVEIGLAFVGLPLAVHLIIGVIVEGVVELMRHRR